MYPYRVHPEITGDPARKYLRQRHSSWKTWRHLRKFWYIGARNIAGFSTFPKISRIEVIILKNAEQGQEIADFCRRESCRSYLATSGWQKSGQDGFRMFGFFQGLGFEVWISAPAF